MLVVEVGVCGSLRSMDGVVQKYFQQQVAEDGLAHQLFWIGTETSAGAGLVRDCCGQRAVLWFAGSHVVFS